MRAGWVVGYRLATKLKLLKLKIKEWARNNFGEVGMRKTHLLEEIQRLDWKEEARQLSLEEDEFRRKVREEGIMWRQKSRCKWLKLERQG